MTQTRVRLWTVNEYHWIFETGIITEDERVELIDGQVIPMSAKNLQPIESEQCPLNSSHFWQSDACGGLRLR